MKKSSEAEFSEEDNDSSQEDANSIIYDDIDRWLERLRRSDRSLYNLMALEVWSIARTMDDIIPGFWSRFMENRQVALKQFVQHRKTQPVADFLTSQGTVEDSADEGDRLS